MAIFYGDECRHRDMVWNGSLPPSVILLSLQTQEKDDQEKIMTKRLLAALMLPAVLFISACNTVEGAGRDMQSAGEAVEGAAEN